MPRRSDSPIWVQGLRAQLRSTVGPAYRLVEQRGKAKLDVRYADGSRGTAVLPVQWVPAQARQIQEAVERVAQQLSMGRTLRQSLELIEGTSSPAPVPPAGPAGRELLAAWEAFGKHKVHRTGQIKASTCFKTRVACAPLSPWAVSGASIQARRIVTFCPLAPVARMVSPSPTDTNVAGPAAAAATGFGWVRLGAGAGAGAMYIVPFDPLPLPVELPPLDGAPPPWQW